MSQVWEHIQMALAEDAAAKMGHEDGAESHEGFRCGTDYYVGAVGENGATGDLYKVSECCFMKGAKEEYRGDPAARERVKGESLVTTVLETKDGRLESVSPIPIQPLAPAR